jgi:hypothetical protein
MTQPQFDPTVIERYAEMLYRKADSVRVGSAVTGAVLGVLFGAAPVSPLGTYLPIPSTFGMATILLGALLGGFIGYAVGQGRAFRIRLQAQMVLFQLQLERNTAGQAPAPPAPVAAPVAAPVVAPVALQPLPVVAVPQPVAPPPAVAAPEPLIPVQRAAAVALPAVQAPPPVAPPSVAPPAPVLAPPPLLAPRPVLEAVPPIEPSLLDAVAVEPREPAQTDELAAPLLPPLSPSAQSGS